MGSWAQSAAWSPDGRELAVTGADMAVWSNGRARGLAMLPTRDLWNADWLPDGEAILNTYGYLYRRRGQHWDRTDLKIDLRGTGWRTLVALSPDGKRLASRPDPGRVKNAGFEIWDLATSKRLVETDPLVGEYACAPAWSPDGALLAAGGRGTVAIYDATTGKHVGESSKTDGYIRPLVWSPDSKTLAAGINGWGCGYVRLCDASGKLVHELTCDSVRHALAEITALHWSADSRTLRVLDREAVYVFDAATGERLAQTPRLDRVPHNFFSLRPANFSPDGRYLAAATTCTRVWDCAELNAVAAGISLKSKVQSPKSQEDADNPNPKLSLVASVVPLGQGRAVVVSGDGHWLGTHGAEKEIVYVIRTAAGQETLTPREFYKRFGWKNDPSKVVLP